MAETDRSLDPVDKEFYVSPESAANYSNVPNPSNVGPGKRFTNRQRVQAVEENRRVNNGVVRSDISGQILTKPVQSQKGIQHSPDEWQVDHIFPRSAGGSNSSTNMQVISRSENLCKSNK
jgi:filamentous hemagglutinin